MKAFDLPITKNTLQTRNDVQKALKQICDPLKPFYSEGRALLSLGNTSASYPDSTADIEGFSRLLWGLAPLLAGGEEYDLWDMQLEGIKNGTNPAHPEYWGEIKDYDQLIVEMAAYGLALAIIPERIWDPLNEQEKLNLVHWLNQVNHHPAHDCNWLFFPILVNLGFKNVGISYDSEIVNQNLDRIDEFYIGGGWYTDGVNGHSDYYVSFAIHYYGLFYAKVMEKEDPKRAQQFKERAKLFANDFIYWFAKDGSALPYGRSMTYRFAQSAFWSAMVYAEVEAFPYGVMKGLILNNLRWWFRQPIFSSDGLLTIGYRYPNLVVGENYNSPGSPYWAFKTFLILALKDNHPFWQAEELPLPSLEEKSIQQHPHLVVCRQDFNNHVATFNTGHCETNEHTHTSAKYEKFVYSNYFGFSVPRAEWGLEQGAFDSMLALSERDNLYRVKRKCEDTDISDGVIYSKWKPWSDVEVNTWIIPGLPIHIRVHCIHTKRYLNAAEGGYALAIEDSRYRNYKMETRQGENDVLVQFPWGVSGIRSLNRAGKSELIYPNANTNLMHSRTVIPTIQTEIKPGTSWLISAVYGEPGVDREKDYWKLDPQVDVKDSQLVVYSRSEQKVIFKKELKIEQLY